MRYNSRKRISKKHVFAIMLTIVLLTVPTLSVFASQGQTRNVYGYAAKYTDSISSSFQINAPGTANSKGGATVKTSDFPDSALVYVELLRPDGSVAFTNKALKGNQEIYLSFYNSKPGIYTLKYTVIGTEKGWLHCWVY